MDGWPASPADFFRDFVLKSRPVLFRGAAKQMKAFKLWTDEYLSSKYGKELVEVEEGKKEDRDLGMWAERFASFLRKYQGKVGCPPLPLLSSISLRLAVSTSRSSFDATLGDAAVPCTHLFASASEASPRHGQHQFAGPRFYR